MKLSSDEVCGGFGSAAASFPGVFFSLYPVYASWHRKHAIYFLVEVALN